MFTGIVQAKAAVAAIETNPFGVRLVIDRSGWRPAHGYQPAAGDSISISGVCLTVVEATGSTMSFDVIAETLDKTTLGDLKPGSAVNLEPPITASQPLGGHFVQVHVDGVGQVTEVQSGTDEWRVAVQPPAELVDYIVPKGSVSLDGVSLTIASVSKSDDGAVVFDVALIPTTLELTTLGQTRAGDRLNIETDILSKTVIQYLRRLGESGEQNVTLETLRHAGFAP